MFFESPVLLKCIFTYNTWKILAFPGHKDIAKMLNFTPSNGVGTGIIYVKLSDAYLSIRTQNITNIVPFTSYILQGENRIVCAYVMCSSTDTMASDSTSISSLSLEDGVMKDMGGDARSVCSVSPSEARPVGSLGPEAFSPPCKYLAAQEFEPAVLSVLPELSAPGFIAQSTNQREGSGASWSKENPTQAVFRLPANKAHHGAQRYNRAQSTEQSAKPVNDFFSDFALDNYLMVDDEQDII